MSAFIFPADPFVGEEFTPENGPTYIWNGYAWDVKSPARAAPSTVIPPGVVVMWSGLLTNIPNGWALCDGTNSTPNLSGKFIMGPDSIYAMHSFGGSADSTLPLHTHQVSQTRSVVTGTTSGGGGHDHIVNDPGHTHGLWCDNDTSGSGGGGPRPYRQEYLNTSQIASAASGITIAGAPDHTHTFSIDIVGGGVGSINDAGASPIGTNLPPYYVLAYIIKL
jgi:microcystin-dependent protein